MTNRTAEEGEEVSSLWGSRGSHFAGSAAFAQGRLKTWPGFSRRILRLGGCVYAQVLSFGPALAACQFALFLCLLPGCATSNVKAKASSSRSNVEEYRRLTCESAAAVHGALRWLEQLDAQAERCPRKLVAGFAEEVDQLQIGSIRVRARAQAIQARGDRYFEAWVEASNSAAKVQAPAKFEQLRGSFVKLKVASQEAGQAFRPFFSGLRKLRAGLEAEPAAIETPETKELIRVTREQGWQVLQKLAVLRDELQVFRAVLAQVKANSGT